MPWLLSEAALKQTVGLAKTHLRQEGRLWRRQLAADTLPLLAPRGSPLARPPDSLCCWVLQHLEGTSRIPRVGWGVGRRSRGEAHLCVRHDSAHAFCLLLQCVLGEVHEGHRTVFCGSIDNLEGIGGQGRAQTLQSREASHSGSGVGRAGSRLV